MNLDGLISETHVHKNRYYEFLRILIDMSVISNLLFTNTKFISTKTPLTEAK